MPRLAAAFANHEIGYEAARLVASVATPDTVEAWVARARERTVRHLREDKFSGVHRRGHGLTRTRS
jgi:hypothetical protein